MQKPNVCTSRKLAVLVVFTFAPSKQKIETLQKTKNRIWDMKGGKYAKIFAKIQDSAIFLCEILGKTDLPKFIELCMETPCWCPSGWVALGKFLEEFVYLAVKICHRDTLPSATPSFQVGKNFENREKHQRRRIAWVGQADFGKLELN